MRRACPASAVLVLLTGVAACGGGSAADDGQEEATLTVYAAASLSAPFEQLGERFEETHEGVEVRLNLAGSSDLVTQIRSGAPADVFASADEATMAKLTAEDLQGTDPEVFATNTLQIAVPPDNPAGVETLQDLADPDLDLVLCAPEVPCGAASRSVAESAGVELQPVSEEQSVTDVLAKVTSGEADAGLVYVTDVVVAGDAVRGIAFPESAAAVNRYPIATVAGSEEPGLAREFTDLVLGRDGRAVLAEHGFGRP